MRVLSERKLFYVARRKKINVHLAMDEFGYLHQELLNNSFRSLNKDIHTHIYIFIGNKNTDQSLTHAQ